MGAPAIQSSMSQGQLIRKRFFGHTAAMVALSLLTFIVLLAFTSIGVGPIPGWWKHDYDGIYPIVNDTKPTFQHIFSWGEHPFGQDRLGGDMFAKTMRGAQQTLLVMTVLGATACALGVVIGALAGYFRGIAENALMRFTEALMITPLILLAAIVGQIATQTQFGRENQVVVFSLMIGALVWATLARLVRAEFLSLREREFVDAARIAGASDNRIIFKHILPNAVGVIIVNTTLVMAGAIILESSLSYLGFGIQPPDVSLGRLISDNQQAFTTRPWLFWWPGAFIVGIGLCINFIGDGLRDAFDPRQKKFNARRATEIPHPEADELDNHPPVLRARSGAPAGN